MVAPENDDRISRQPQAIQLVQHPADLRIDETHGGVIAMDHGACLVIGQRPGFRDIAVISEFAPSGWSVGRCSLGWRAKLRQLEGIATVKVPVLFRRAKWQVRFEEADRQKEGTTPFFRGVQSSDSFAGDFAIRIGIVRHVRRFVGRAARKFRDIGVIIEESRLTGQGLLIFR